MISSALIPLLGLLLLLLVTVVVLSIRSGRRARSKTTVEERQLQAREAERDASLNFVSDLRQGRPADESFLRLQQQRREAFPEPGRSGAAWTERELLEWGTRELATRLVALNRRLIAGACAATIAIALGCFAAILVWPTPSVPEPALRSGRRSAGAGSQQPRVPAESISPDPLPRSGVASASR
jgi:hypothetical protein